MLYLPTCEIKTAPATDRIGQLCLLKEEEETIS